MTRLKQYLTKASFASESDKLAALACLSDMERKLDMAREAIGIIAHGKQSMRDYANDMLARTAPERPSAITLVAELQAIIDGRA